MTNLNEEEFIEKIKHKNIMVCGIGKSNLPLLNMLTGEGITVTAYDRRHESKLPSSIISNLKSNSNIVLRAGDENVWDESYDIIIRTPGISFLSENIIKMRRHGTVVTSEMEIFFELCPCPIIGITGSDGKTTTTTIISKILEENGNKVHLGGNIGHPLLPKIKEIKKDDIAVVELSSFQLMSMRNSPTRAVVTNISPNHLDFHSSIDEYVESKKQIIYHQLPFSCTILNFDNPQTREMSKDVRGKCIFFSRANRLNSGVWIRKNGDIIYSFNGNDNFVINSDSIKIPGKHNIDNYLAAIACVYDMVSLESIEKVAKKFSGVEHRIEFVRSLNGVSYYNDSIASTPTRTIKGALSLFDKKVILIAGGYDKKVPFDSLATEILKKVSTLVLMGDSGPKIYKEILNLKEYNSNLIEIIFVNNMNEAVNYTKNHSKDGDIVILSPACASFGFYENFEERGKHFKNLVMNLSKKTGVELK